MHRFLPFFAILALAPVLAEEKQQAPAAPAAGAVPTATVSATPEKPPEEATFIIGGVKLSIESAINIVLEKNLVLQAAKYDVVMSDTAAKKLEKKYAPTLGAETRHLDFSNNPFGTLGPNYQNDVIAQVSKLFSSGTTIGGGYRLQNVQSSAIPSFGYPGGSQVFNGFFINVQQELLKNSFGYADRKMDKIAQKQGEGQRAAAINLLSSLVVQALTDYWQVTIQKYALENAKLEEKSNRQVRAIVARNVAYGLGESYDLNNYNSRVAASVAKVALMEQNLRNVTRKLLRTMNMPVDTKIDGITDLVDTLPSLDQNQALKAATEKRVDLRNAKLDLEVATLQTDLYDNQALPSLTAYFNMVSQGTNAFPAFPNSPFVLFQYPQWQVGIKASYPLWDQEVKVNQRNAGMILTQSRIKLANMEQEIRDDVLTRLENVRLNYEIYQTSKTSRKESETFYNRMLLERVQVNSISSWSVRPWKAWLRAAKKSSSPW